MKSVIKLLSLLFVILVLTDTANAESPREQLRQMVEQLQKSSNDIALREKIIKLAQQLKPAPAIPEEAERRMQRGAAALEGVKSVAGYRDAAKEFEQATLAAPWYGDAYFNLGVAQDKAENYEAALRSLKFALLASPDDKEIKALIFKVEYRNEKMHSPEEAIRRKAEEEKMIAALDGAHYDCPNYSDAATHEAYWYEIKRGELSKWSKVVWARDDFIRANPKTFAIGSVHQNSESLKLSGKVYIERGPNWTNTYTVSEDSIVVQQELNGQISSEICKRR